MVPPAGHTFKTEAVKVKRSRAGQTSPVAGELSNCVIRGCSRVERINALGKSNLLSIHAATHKLFDHYICMYVIRCID